MGIHYECPWAFRAKVEVAVGKPIALGLPEGLSAGEKLKTLKLRIQAGLEEVGINVPSADDQARIERLAYAATLATPRSYFDSLKALERGIPEPLRTAEENLAPKLSEAKLLFHQGVPLFPLGPVGLYALALALLAPVVLGAIALNLPPLRGGLGRRTKTPRRPECCLPVEDTGRGAGLMDVDGERCRRLFASWPATVASRLRRSHLGWSASLLPRQETGRGGPQWSALPGAQARHAGIPRNPAPQLARGEREFRRALNMDMETTKALAAESARIPPGWPRALLWPAAARGLLRLVLLVTWVRLVFAEGLFERGRPALPWPDGGQCRGGLVLPVPRRSRTLPARTRCSILSR